MPTPATEPLVARLVEEMTVRWLGGDRPRAEEFLAAHPRLWQKPEAAADLIYEELCLRQQAGESVSATEYRQRFPQWQEQLDVLLRCHRLLEGTPPGPRFPAVGETLGDFHLRAELGRGGQGRVFLAAQRSLADRLVVLKCTPLAGEEHLSLARLQHTHIVPLYAVQDDLERQLRVLCMPYFGCATLAHLWHELRAVPLEQRTGRHLIEALDRIEAGLAVPQAQAPLALGDRGRTEGPARLFLSQATFVQAVCWLGACLADALHYAHERRLIHLDVKPSNVLLAADGQPMLLDFHLAQAPLQPAGPVPEWLGGTPGCMAPEQEAALEALRRGQPIPQPVDGRADVCALGLLLYEALGDTQPAQPPVPLTHLNPQVSPGLADLIARCLAPDPARRYPHAADVADDLRRHLAHRPLCGVPNRSWRERWQKWRRRQPPGLALVGAVLVVLLAGFITFNSWRETARRQEAEARTLLNEGQRRLQQGQPAEAVVALRRGLVLAERLPQSQLLSGDLSAQLRRAERARLAGELHLLTEQLRLLGCLEPPAPEQLRTVEASCQAFWDKRGQLRQQLALGAAAERDSGVTSDLLDLALLWTDLRVRLAAPAEESAARTAALGVLDETERLCGPSLLLDHERRRQAEALGQTDVAQAASARLANQQPRTAWEHLALGRALLQAGQVDAATPLLERAVELHPQNVWAHFCRGSAAYRQGRLEEAATAFSICVALAPTRAVFWYQRALAETGRGRTRHALADYDRALQFDPQLGAAALHRGLLHFQERRHGRAAADLQRALRTGADAATVHYNLALVQLAQQDRAAARLSLRQALRQKEHAEARSLLSGLDQER